MQEYLDIESEPILFATGAHIAPMQIKGVGWVWVVTQFEDDTFGDGGYVRTREYANTKEELIISEEDN